MSKLEKIFFFAYGPYLGHFTLKPQPSPLLTCMTYIWDQESNLLFAKHPDNRPCSRSANTSYILATSCASILERWGIYNNLHLLSKPSMTDAINSNPGFIPVLLAVLSWVLRSLPLLLPATIWLHPQRRSRFRNKIVLMWMVKDFKVKSIYFFTGLRWIDRRTSEQQHLHALRPVCVKKLFLQLSQSPERCVKESGRSHHQFVCYCTRSSCLTKKPMWLCTRCFRKCIFTIYILLLSSVLVSYQSITSQYYP